MRKAKYKKRMKALTFGEVGVVSAMYKANKNNKDDWIVITYPQNKGTDMVYAHSCKIKDIELL